MANEEKKELPRYTVFIPSDHNIDLKVVPSKEFFEKKMSDQSALEIFDLDAKREIQDQTRYETEAKYAVRLDSLASRLPDDLLKNLAATYTSIRNIKGNVKIKDGLIFITNSKGKMLALRLEHVLSIICSAPPAKSKKVLVDELKRSANYYKVVAKTSVIEAKTRKSF